MCKCNVLLHKCDCEWKQVCARKGGVFLSDSITMNFSVHSLVFLRNHLHLAYLLVYLCSYLHGRSNMQGCEHKCRTAGKLGSDFSPFLLCNCNDIAYPFPIMSEMSIDFHGCFSPSVWGKLIWAVLPGLFLPCSEALDYADNYTATRVRLPPVRTPTSRGQEKSHIAQRSLLATNQL